MNVLMVYSAGILIAWLAMAALLLQDGVDRTHWSDWAIAVCVGLLWPVALAFSLLFAAMCAFDRRSA